MAKACGKTMTAVFASREEEIMKKIAEKVMKALRPLRSAKTSPMSRRSTWLRRARVA
jgi:hypothetical protein